MARVCESAAGADAGADGTERSTPNVQLSTLKFVLTESGSGTLAGNAHQEAFNQVAKADSVMVSEALRRDFDKPLLAAAFPGWPVEAGFGLRMDDKARVAE